MALIVGLCALALGALYLTLVGLDNLSRGNRVFAIMAALLVCGTLLLIVHTMEAIETAYLERAAGARAD